MSSRLLIYDTAAVRVLTLNRIECLNALDTPIRQEVAAQLAAAQADSAIRALVITGAGERAFCAGQDLTESAALKSGDGPPWMASWRAYFDAFCGFTKPIIAAVNGVAAGAGFQTALLSDFRLAAPQARFSMAEIDVGLPAITGGYLLNLHLGRARATELVLTGRMIEAAEAKQIGLIHEIAQCGDLVARALVLAVELASKPPIAMRLNLERFRSVLRAGLVEAEEAATAYQSEAVASGVPQRIMADFLAQRLARRGLRETPT